MHALVKSKLSSNNTRDDSTYGYHQVVNTEIRLIIFFAAEDGEALYSQKKKNLAADCGLDHELLIANFRLKLKKVEKTCRPFRYELWTEVCNIVQEEVIKTISRKNARRQNDCLRCPYR